MAGPFVVIDRRRLDTIWKGVRVYRPAIQKKNQIDGKGLEPLLRMSVEERLDKYFEFCRAFDKREDHVIRDHFQQHSHRLHWQEHPFVDVIRDVDSLRDRIWFTLVFSFTNEHWLTFKTLVDHGPKELRKRFKTERHARMDLFQIYYPKDTVVKEWIISGTKQAADAMVSRVRGRNRRWGMMNLAHEFADHFVREQGFRSALYPCKNFARYLAMGCPELVDPESWIHPGTGSFRGLQQIFGGHLLMSKAKYDVDEDGKFLPLNAAALELKKQFTILCGHPDSPVGEMSKINHEDKACMFFKRLAHEVDLQKPTPAIPYEWIFPVNWSLRSGKYDRDPKAPRNEL